MKFQSFVNFPKEIKEVIKMLLRFWFFTCCPHSFSFRASFFIKRPYESLYSYFHYVQTCWIWKSYLNTYVKNWKNMFILKFHPGWSVYTSFFLLSSRDEIWSRDEISSWQKRVNSKRHFTLNRDDFIPGRVSFRGEISRVNTL